MNRTQPITWSALAAFIALLPVTCASAQDAGSTSPRFEVRFLGGGIAAGNLLLGQPGFSSGVETGIKLSRVVSLTGRYVYDSLGTVNGYCAGLCVQNQSTDKLHEFGGGFRFTAPSGSRVETYGEIAVGGARYSHSYAYSYAAYVVSGNIVAPAFGGASSSARTQFAMTLSGGINYRLTRRTGINFDVSGVGVAFPNSAGWLVRPSAGFYFRF